MRIKGVPTYPVLMPADNSMPKKKQSLQTQIQETNFSNKLSSPSKRKRAKSTTDSSKTKTKRVRKEKSKSKTKQD